jgi:hypothetical protein
MRGNLDNEHLFSSGSDAMIFSKSPLERLTSNQLTLSEFLKIIFLNILSILGFSNNIHFLTAKHTASHSISSSEYIPCFNHINIQDSVGTL